MRRHGNPLLVHRHHRSGSGRGQLRLLNRRGRRCHSHNRRPRRGPGLRRRLRNSAGFDRLRRRAPLPRPECKPTVRTTAVRHSPVRRACGLPVQSSCGSVIVCLLLGIGRIAFRIGTFRRHMGRRAMGTDLAAQPNANGHSGAARGGLGLIAIFLRHALNAPRRFHGHVYADFTVTWVCPNRRTLVRHGLTKRYTVFCANFQSQITSAFSID